MVKYDGEFAVAYAYQIHRYDKTIIKCSGDPAKEVRVPITDPILGGPWIFLDSPCSVV